MSTLSFLKQLACAPKYSEKFDSLLASQSTDIQKAFMNNDSNLFKHTTGTAGQFQADASFQVTL